MTDIVVCSTNLPTVPGSLPTLCADCHTRIWISPATRLIARSTDATIICIPCAETRIANDPNPVILPPTTAQRTEANRAAWQ